MLFFQLQQLEVNVSTSPGCVYNVFIQLTTITTDLNLFKK